MVSVPRGLELQAPTSPGRPTPSEALRRRPPTLTGMLDREACERRVYRLAVLLTGDPAAAARVIADVVGARGDLRDLDSAHLDRLTILRCRERPIGRKKAVPTPDDEARGVLDAMDGMPPQLREAWVLTRVYRLDAREAARSMDCSVTATDRHLEAGAKAMDTVLGTTGTAAAAEHLLRYSLSLDVPEIYRARMRRRRRLRLAWRVALVVLIVAALAVAGAWLWRLRPGP